MWDLAHLMSGFQMRLSSNLEPLTIGLPDYRAFFGSSDLDLYDQF